MSLKTYPDPCLRVRTGIVEIFDQDLADVLRVMRETMYLSQGIGLAATQIGLGLRLFVMDYGEGPTDFVNPEIVSVSKRKTVLEEGCLSFPGVTVKVARPETVEVRAQDQRGDFFIKRYDSLAAKVVQHEYDHLNGKVIIDHLDPFRRFVVSRILSFRKKKNEKGKCEVTCNVGKRNS